MRIGELIKRLRKGETVTIKSSNNGFIPGIMGFIDRHYLEAEVSIKTGKEKITFIPKGKFIKREP